MLVIELYHGYRKISDILMRSTALSKKKKSEENHSYTDLWNLLKI